MKSKFTENGLKSRKRITAYSTDTAHAAKQDAQATAGREPSLRIAMQASLAYCFPLTINSIYDFNP